MVNGVFTFKAPGGCQMSVAPCHNKTRLICIFFFRVCELAVQNRLLQIWGSFWFLSIMKLLLNSPLNAHVREKEGDRGACCNFSLLSCLTHHHTRHKFWQDGCIDSKKVASPFRHFWSWAPTERGTFPLRSLSLYFTAICSQSLLPLFFSSSLPCLPSNR